MSIEPEDFKRARGALGLKQGEFAKMVGLSRQTISEYENGHEPVGLQTYLLAIAWAGNEAAFVERKKQVGLYK